MPILIPTYHLQLMNHAKYTSCSIIYISLIIQSYSTKNRSFRNQQTSNHSTVLPSTSLRLRGLVQARQSRSGKFPLRLGEGTRTGAWATRDLALARSLSPGRVACSLRSRAGRLDDLSRKNDPGESLFISPKRDWLAWARITGFATVLLQQSFSPHQNNIPNAF